MARGGVLAEIDSLDPDVEFERICFLSTNHDFPWDVEQSLSLAFFKTYSIPRISELLDRTGEFRQQAQKRYDDTKLILAEILDAGLDSERGRGANRRMNLMHSRFSISNEDYLYVLSTLVLEPIRWNARWGWRPYTDKESRAHLEYWRELGRRMHIHDVPPDLDELERWSRGFEAANLRFAHSNRRVADQTLSLFASWYPPPLRPLVRIAILAMLEDSVVDAFGYAHPPRWLRVTLDLGLRARARILRFLPRRRVPRLMSRERTRTYRFGHHLTDLGVPGVGQPGKQ
jgi:mpaB/rubber oxygenase-like protein